MSFHMSVTFGPISAITVIAPTTIRPQTRPHSSVSVPESSFKNATIFRITGSQLSSVGCSAARPTPASVHILTNPLTLRRAIPPHPGLRFVDMSNAFANDRRVYGLAQFSQGKDEKEMRIFVKCPETGGNMRVAYDFPDSRLTRAKAGESPARSERR